MILETIYKYRVMKALNILSVLFFLLVATACSSESDTIMNDIDKEVETASEVYASFGVSLAASDIQTRAAVNAGEEAANSSESTVNNCYIAVFEKEGGKLLGSKLYNGNDIEVSDNGYTLKKNIVFKVPANGERKDLTIVAVANISKSITGIQNLSYNDLMNFTLTEEPDMLVKVGKLGIARGEYDVYMTISPSMFPDPDKVTPITIEVAQRSAAIELNELVINEGQNNTSDIKVEKIKLINKNFSTKVGGYLGNNGDIRESDEVDASKVGNLLNYRLYTYGNMSATKTALYFEYSYKLNDKLETGKCTFTIKTPTDNGDVEKVEANHLYKLNVKITNGVATATIQCSTKDWNEGNKGETIVIPVKENK